ncbi:hypothetical protein M595_3788 [Lyngbya aestuarii BL J]|uniref:Uncharacterized protein n=1 Tax=Lyngbya aestuarii BL J TaxID=1348334 RepID=U7QEC8_9CYAN|nr:hypothetical protein M595_3788 [Lyngbya aestuarii BL J]
MAAYIKPFSLNDYNLRFSETSARDPKSLPVVLESLDDLN